MDENMIGIDIGYSSTKVVYMGKIVKFPTAVSYASDVGITYGEENLYEFEGEKYYVGKEAVSEEAFVTTDYKFLYKFAPIIIYHILSKFEEAQRDEPLEIRTGLAIVDWNNREEFANRITNFTVNGINVETNPILIPQGAGVATDWTNTNTDGEYPYRLHVLDIGFNTINSLHFEDGNPNRAKTKTYPGHGVSSIIKPFTSYIENKYAMNFSEQEAIGIFIRGTFKYNGEEQPDLENKIIELKSRCIRCCFSCWWWSLFITRYSISAKCGIRRFSV